jgi:hypothetical protein
MAEISCELSVTLVLNKREFALVQKALCGALRAPSPELNEPAEARELGLRLLQIFAESLQTKAAAAAHALTKAGE